MKQIRISLASLLMLGFLFSTLFSSCGAKKEEAKEETPTEQSGDSPEEEDHQEGAEHPEGKEHPKGEEHPEGGEHPSKDDSKANKDAKS
ncbi:MAG: hypothetical protein ACK5BR_07915 [Bacteroidota bacterium]|jgi:hypothetical protein|nr:hypothetical protein [Algoriphagus sp.]